ncbi:MAG TPA: glutathione peroxidase [Bacteroidia bacterium]|nr:glutathione peroxidase [Bacteroidia bacterium]
MGCKQVIKSRPADGKVQPASESIYNFKMKSLEGNLIDFAQYRGKKILIVNTASKCGYTPQYSDLEKLHEQYGNKVVLLGFPANNFLHQEPGNGQEIAEFCTKNYGVTFQMFEKVSVKGSDQCDLYRWLSDKKKNGWNDQAPTWNFCKYLISESGELLKFYPSAVKPLDPELLEDIKR